MSKVGGDFVSGLTKISKKLGIKLKNWHLPKHNFTGPFTELDKRIDENDNPLPGYEPYNQIDNIALHHDICYRDSNSKKIDKSISDCDKQMLNDLEAIKTKNLREKLDYALVKPVIWLKYKLGFGLPEDIQLAKELHAPIRHKFKRRRVMVYNIDYYSKYNNGCKYMLNVIDLSSKYVYSIPLKSKSPQEVMGALKKLFLEKKLAKLFDDSQFAKFLKDNNIDLYYTYNEGKEVVIGSTLGDMIQKNMTSTRSIHVLQKLIDEYNNRNHTSIKITPYETSKEDVYNNLYGNQSQKKFNVGDRVRIYKYKNTFEKGYKPNWTREVFEIYEIRNTNPVTYRIKDLSNEPILGSFYDSELHTTKF